MRKKDFFVIPSEARDLLFFSASKKQQIPRANPALRNDMVRVFPQPVEGNSLSYPNEFHASGGYPRMEMSLKLRTTRPPEVKRPKLICGRKREKSSTKSSWRRTKSVSGPARIL